MKYELLTMLFLFQVLSIESLYLNMHHGWYEHARRTDCK